MNHTPGPWEAHDQAADFGDENVQSWGVCLPPRLAPSHGPNVWSRPYIAHLTLHVGNDESKANAHLIAAAPDLLAIVERLLEDDWRHAFPHHIRDIMSNAVDKARGTS